MRALRHFGPVLTAVLVAACGLLSLLWPEWSVELRAQGVYLPVVTVVATNSSASETGPVLGAFTVTRTGDVSVALTVSFTLGGTALNGIDYVALGTTVTIPAGQGAATVTVTPIADGAAEGTESVVVTLSPAATYNIGAPGRAVVFITDVGPVRPSILTPANGTQIVLGGLTNVTVQWTPLEGVVEYFFEFTGANLRFANANGTANDSINGFLGAGGGIITTGTSLVATLDPSFPPGLYEIRVIALDPATRVPPVGVFSDAVTLNIQIAGISPDARPVFTSPPSGSVFAPGARVTFSWTPVPGVSRYRFEFTNGQFSNPNGTGSDPGALGSFEVDGASVEVVIPAVQPGTYRVRVIALTPAGGHPVGTFSDDLAVEVTQ
jgi:hypothetical protein